MLPRTLLVLNLVLAPAWSEEGDRAQVAVKLEPVKSSETKPRLLFPRLAITLGKKPIEGFPKLSPLGRYALLRAGGRDLKFALDAPTGSHALGILQGKDGKRVIGRAEEAGRGLLRIAFSNALIDGVPLNIYLVYRGTRLIEATAEPALHMRGKIVMEGVVRAVVVIDNDGDGKFNGLEDRWIAMRQDRIVKVGTLRAPATMRRDEPQVPFQEDGTALLVRDVAADGSQLVLVRGTPSQPLDRVLARRYVEFRGEYFAAFRREGDGFARRAGLDLTRKTVDRPVIWPRETLEEAQARAKKARRPLLVAYYTETNDWWWRSLFTTFRDANVDRILRRFERVAIDAEKDAAQSFKKSGARALPALQFFTPDGQPISFRLRSRDQAGEVRELGRTSTGITGWQRPADLEVNLRRIMEAMLPR